MPLLNPECRVLDSVDQRLRRHDREVGPEPKQEARDLAFVAAVHRESQHLVVAALLGQHSQHMAGWAKIGGSVLSMIAGGIGVAKFLPFRQLIETIKSDAAPGSLDGAIKSLMANAMRLGPGFYVLVIASAATIIAIVALRLKREKTGGGDPTTSPPSTNRRDSVGVDRGRSNVPAMGGTCLRGSSSPAAERKRSAAGATEGTINGESQDGTPVCCRGWFGVLTQPGSGGSSSGCSAANER